MDDRSQLHLQDLELARECSAGNPLAWERFTELYGPRIYAAALAISRNDSIARELADSLYGEIFASKLKSYAGRGSLEGWLKAVLCQTYVDRYRSQKRVVSLDENLAKLQDRLQSDSGRPVAPDPRLNDAVKEAFLTLPPDQRYLLAAYFFDQQTLADLGRILGVHESTVSRRLDKLVRMLRTRISRLLRDKGMTLREVRETLTTDVRELSFDLRSQLARE